MQEFISLAKLKYARESGALQVSFIFYNLINYNTCSHTCSKENKFTQVVFNFKQDEDSAAIVCRVENGWTLDHPFHKVIKVLSQYDSTTVFDCQDNKMAEGFNDGSVDIFFTFQSKSKKPSTVSYSVIKSDEGNILK